MVDKNASPELMVGVKVGPDGKLDTSQALFMKGETTISDPIVDRLRGPLQVDEKREKHYWDLQDALVKEDEAGNFPNWFVDLLNRIKTHDGSAITLEDVGSLQLVTGAPELKQLQDAFGHKFIRPYFQLNLADYRRVY